MKVYMIRHGETNGNTEKFHQGWGDAYLTEKGIAQANAIKEVVTKKKFDRILSSDLFRTKQTCGIIFGQDAKVEYDARLREINNSVLTGMYADDMLAKYGDVYLDARKRMDFSAFGGENAESFMERTADFLKYLETDTTSDNIAVVSHGGTIRAIMCNVLGCDLRSYKLQIDNCSVCVIKYHKGHWTLVHVNNHHEI